MSREDDALIRDARSGSARAIELLITKYESKAYTLACRLLGNHADAADAVQEAMMKVYRRLHQFQTGTEFHSWLFRVVHNTCLDELRRRSRRYAMETTVVDRSGSAMDMDSRVAALPDATDSPDELLDRAESSRVLWRAINTLSPQYREVVVLHHFDDYSCPEIAARLGETVGAVKVRLHRARQALRRAMVAQDALAG